MSKYSRYDNGYGYRFNCLCRKKKNNILLKACNGMDRYFRTRDSAVNYSIKDIDRIYTTKFNIDKEVNFKIVFNSDILYMILNRYNLYNNAGVINTNDDNIKIIAIDCDYFVENNIDLQFVLYHEIGHIISRTTNDHCRNIENEKIADLIAFYIVGYDTSINALKNSYILSETLYNKIEFLERIEYLEDEYIKKEIREGIA